MAKGKGLKVKRFLEDFSGFKRQIQQSPVRA